MNNRRYYGRSLVSIIWSLLFLIGTLIYAIPSLANEENSIFPYIITSVVFVTIVICEFKVLKLNQKIAIALLVAALFVLVFYCRGFATGLFMIPILTLFAIFEFRQVNWTYRYEKFFCNCCIVISVIMLYHTITVLTGSYERENSYNMNTIACMQFYCFSIYYITSFNKTNLQSKIFKLFYLIVTIGSIIVVGSRTGLLCLALFLILCTLYKIKKEKIIKRSFAWACILVLGGYLFPLLYIYLYGKYGNDGLTFMGKELFTGREYIWNYNIENLTSSPINLLFGTNKISIYQIENNLHNMYLTFLIRIGVVGVSLYWILFLGMFNRCIKKIKNEFRLQKINLSHIHLYVFLLLTILLYGYFEKGFSWAIFMPFGLYPFLVLMSNYYKTKQIS